MSETEARSDVRKTNVTLERSDMRDFKRLMLDWEEEKDFPIELKESHCLNTAVKLIIRSSNPKLVDEYLDRTGTTDKDARKRVHELYEWFLKQYIELLSEVVDSRIESDKRRAPRK
ncbi:hypothetical protein [Nocardia sp. NPDC059228]|uniref:hypothetical protein n=1 Tax=Nocardia sp. NPDC059228 TaxID=3346777 RepID=UPI0036761BEB